MNPRISLTIYPFAAVVLLACSAATRAQGISMQPNSARQCAVCHLKWVDQLASRHTYTLIDAPAQAVVADEDTCLGCHDGSVGDSRCCVWSQHGHQTGIAPPDDMIIPDTLPLDDGKLSCRTCHTAHAGMAGSRRGDAGRVDHGNASTSGTDVTVGSGSTAGMAGSRPETLASTFFVRIPNEAGQLCMACHQNYADGAAQGSHPLAHMDTPLPETFRIGGGELSPDNTITCETCHRPHGRELEHLLVANPDKEGFCTACHDDIPADPADNSTAHVHPVRVTLKNTTQLQAVRDMHAPLGADDTIVCRTCHRSHKGYGDRYMLTAPLNDATLCLNCHQQFANVTGSVHDLGTTAPDVRNDLGHTATQTGSCSACHGTHQPARAAKASPLDNEGLCITCHAEGQCAAQAGGLQFAHTAQIPAEQLASLQAAVSSTSETNASDSVKHATSLQCYTCHDPHTTSHHALLRAEQDTICATCHTQHHSKLAGAHADLGPNGSCSACHAVHDGSTSAALWPAGHGTVDSIEQSCTYCHNPAGMAADAVAGALLHPPVPATHDKSHSTCTAEHSRFMPQDGNVRLQSYTSTSGTGLQQSGCTACHDPHGDSQAMTAMLAGSTADDAAASCMNCHESTASLPGSLHSQRILQDHMGDRFVSHSRLSCGPCHATHAPAGHTHDPAQPVHAAGSLYTPATGQNNERDRSAAKRFHRDMWVGPLGPASQPPEMRHCTGCHQPDGPAIDVYIQIHPDVVIQNINEPGEDGYMPLFNAAGEQVPDGRISCETCHLPHGRTLAGYETSDKIAMSVEQLKLLSPMVRPYVASNLCSSCHGYDGLNRYLYYHLPEKRRALSIGMTP